MRLIMGMALALILFSFYVSRADDTIKIGVILAMTGGTSAFGQQTWTGMQIGRNIRPTVLGKKVELILLDNKSDKIESANAAQRLIQKDKVIGIIGDVASSNSLAIAPIAEDNHIPHISPSSTNPIVTLNRKYVFRACFIDPFQGEVMAKFAYNELKARKAAVLTDIGQDYSVGLTSAFVKTYKKLGGQIVRQVNYQSGDQDFTAHLTAIKETNPDIIATLIAGDGAEAPELTEIGEEAVDGLYYTTHFDEKAVLTPLGKKYVEMFRKQNKSTPDALGALGADAYLIILDAIERTSSTNPEKIRDAIEKTKDFQGITGAITINKNHDAVKRVVIRQVKGRDSVYISSVNP